MNNCPKASYKSKGAAEAHLRSLLERGDDFRDSAALCTYLHAGHGWHVGHRPDLKIKSDIEVPLVFDGRILWLVSPDGSKQRVGLCKPSGEWSFWTLGPTHGNILNKLIGVTHE